MIYVNRGDTKRVELSFTNDDGSVLNLSGATVYFTAKRTWEDADGAALIEKTITGHAAPESGITYMDLTTSDTNLCPGDYVAGFQLQDYNNNISTLNIDGISILPSPRIIT